MRKYGIEHFKIELVEETENPVEREIYWIGFYDGYNQGYNATMGGDGKRYLDYDLLISAYKELGSVKAVCDKYNCNDGYLGRILRENGFNTIEHSHQLSIQKNGIIVNQYDKQGNYIKTFPSAAQALGEVSPNTTSKSGGVSHILDVCRGKRKTAYGYIWRFSISTTEEEH